MHATIQESHKNKGYQHFKSISTDARRCGKVWKATKAHINRGIMGNLQIYESCTLVAWQGEDGGVHIRMHMLLAELLIQALHGAIRRVIVLAEVAEHNVFHARVVHIGHKPRRLFIAQMTERPRDALLQYIRIRAFFQHLRIIVGLDDEIVGPADLLLHHLVEHPDVGGNGQGMSFIIKMIAYRTTPVVHHRESLHSDATHLERLQGIDFVEKPRIDILCSLAFDDTLQAIGMGIDWDGMVLGQHFQTFDVVDVIVRDEDSFDISDTQVILSQPCNDLLGSDAHVHQNAFVLLAHIIAIAAAARGKAAKDKGRKARKKVHLKSFWAQK